MLWADVQVGEGWLVGVAGLMTAGGAVLVSVMNAHHKNRLEKERSAVTDLQAICDRQERQLDRHEASERELAEALTAMAREHTACREALIRQQSQIDMLVEHIRRQSQAIKDLGGKVDPLPDFAAVVPPPNSGHDQFVQRTLEQNAQLLQGIDTRIKPENKSP